MGEGALRAGWANGFIHTYISTAKHISKRSRKITVTFLSFESLTQKHLKIRNGAFCKAWL